MQVVRYHAPGDIRIEELPVPRPGPGEITLRVRACSVCGTDLKISRFGHHRIRPPRVLGHEIAGEIAELGTGARGVAVADRVQVIASIPCGRCADCQRGRETVCSRQQAMGYHYDGGFAEYVLVPSAALAVGGVNRIPEGVGFAEASIAEPLACVLHGQELAGVGDGDVVAVVGAGPIGCLHVRAARSQGAAQVILLGQTRERVGRAAQIVKPDHLICPDDGDVAEQVLAVTDGRGADVIVMAAASGRAHSQALRYAAPRGRISFFAGLPAEASPAFDINLVHYRELTMIGASGSRPAQHARALDLIASGAVPVADLITHRLPVDGFPEALDLLSRGEAVKATIEP